ncbi:MAG TPA: CcmD family protein [Vicinamibacterales bacterium]|nr:CcmD family protein [Vicinamibacterales bacterium]
MRRLLSLSFAFILVALPSFALQQPPSPPEGFVPASSLPGQEQLPAAPLVIIAYAVVWLLVLGYLWSIWSRLTQAERELADVSRRLAAGQRR